ncbi:right-handed parallel beta-helix repeat-containing protein [bacterium]|nr:right-handed parallel beta-helix repeat-containing protein [bacterium]
MKKHLISLTAALFIFIAAAQAQLSGPLSGILEGNTTYTVVGDISVEADDSLIIEAGATLIFNQGIDFDINGYLHAAGTETDSIRFVNSPGSNWGGIDFNNSADDSSKLGYCFITGSSSSGIDCDNSSLAISNCTISGNTDGYGGGICCYHSSPSITDCTISGNTAGHGGGIRCSSSYPAITNCTISNNIAVAGVGGGIYCSSSSPSITNCAISGNMAVSNGGGISCLDNSSPAITGCAISGNTAGYGGGIYCGYYSPAITNCAISGNTAVYNGGGIYCSSSSNPAITNCTISGNTAAGYGSSVGGGGICYYSNSSPEILNTIVSGNLGNYGVYLSSYSNPTITFSDFYNNQNGNFNNPPQWIGQITTTNANGDSCDQFYNIFFNPLFYSTTGDSAYYLTAGSPCIDAGDPASPPDPDGSIADIGAFPYDSSWVSVDEPKICLMPSKTSLHYPYPNPFNPSSTISYQLSADSYVELIVYDIQGREVQSLVTGHLSLGYHEVLFDGRDLSSGMYFVRLTVDSRQSTVKKMVLMK